MRWAALALRIIGWLLTPLVAWAASFLGAWLILLVAGDGSTPRAVMGIALGAAVLAGAIALLLWRQLLRRFPRLRRSLRVSTAGLPVIEEPASAPTHASESKTDGPV